MHDEMSAAKLKFLQGLIDYMRSLELEKEEAPPMDEIMDKVGEDVAEQQEEPMEAEVEVEDEPMDEDSKKMRDFFSNRDRPSFGKGALGVVIEKSTPMKKEVEIMKKKKKG